MESSVPLIKKELTFVFVVGLFQFFVVLVFCVGRSVVAFGKSGPVLVTQIGVESVALYKGGEKLDETEENLLEHRTDGTDAFDTLYIGAEKFPQRNFYPVAASGVL